MEIVVNSMEENHQTISEFEIKLAQFNDLPNDIDLLKDVSATISITGSFNTIKIDS